MTVTMPTTEALLGRVQAEGAALARRLWYSMRRLSWSSYWELHVSGAANVPSNGPMLLCANHTSHLDAPAILAALPRQIALGTSTAAAKDVFGDHFLHRFISRVLTNALPIERSAEFPGGLRALESVLRQQRPLILFPEGRRSPDGGMLDFKLGAAMLAIRTGAPIVPIRLDGLHKSLARGKHFPRPARVYVRFLPAIDPRPLRLAIERGEIDRRRAYEKLTAQLRLTIENASLMPARAPIDTIARFAPAPLER